MVKAMSEEKHLSDSSWNKLLFFSVHTAFTFGGFLEMAFQSALSALSNYSDELLLSDRAEVLRKIFNSYLCLVLKCPLSRPKYEGLVSGIVPVWGPHTKQCSPEGLGLRNEVQNCEETLKKETIPEVLIV